jgi:2-polyprenyl-3-methyl-5-hydroxy-6-metoxy-1,4-benzoquinol methylase
MKVDEGSAAWEEISEGWAELMRTATGPGQTRTVILDGPHLQLLGDVKGKRILDAGCGEGRFARMLADLGASVTAIDLSFRMIELAQAEEAKTPLGIEFAEMSMTDLSPFADETFDAGVAYLSILDVEDFETALREIARTLKPSGRFVFSTVHPCFYPPDSSWEPRKPGTIPLFDKDKLFRKVDHYFPAREVRFRMWPTAPAETVNYHRPISVYAHACRDAGLLIRDIIEPVPDEKVLAERDYLREYVRAPGMILFECVKAAVE